MSIEERLSETEFKAWRYVSSDGYNVTSVLKPESVKKIMAWIEQERRKAAFKELTMLGRLYNGSKKAYLDHYEARYKELENDGGTDA